MTSSGGAEISPDVILTVGYAIAVVLGVGTMLFGGRAISVLRRPPTGEAGRELVFLTARELIPPFGVILLVLVLEWVEWLVTGLRAAELVTLSSFAFYTDLAQGLLLFVAAVMAFRVLIPYTRARRTQHTRLTLDRLAARVALLRGRK